MLGEEIAESRRVDAVRRATRSRVDDRAAAMETSVSAMAGGEVVLVIFACCIGAMLIGAVGIGGVVILPALLVAGVSPAVGIVSIYVAFAPAALMKLFILGRVRGLIPWSAALSCGSTAAIGAAVGGILVESSPRRALTFLIGAVAALAGLRDAWEIFQRSRRAREEKSASADGDPGGDPGAEPGDPPAKSDDAEDAVPPGTPPRDDKAISETIDVEICSPPPTPPRAWRERVSAAYFSDDSIPDDERWNATGREMAILAAMGVLVGCASVLTGTGGPLILIPALLTWKGNAVSRKVVVGCGSVLAACLVCAAVISILSSGVRPDAGLTLLMAPCAIGGTAAGARVLQVASREFLQAIMTVLLLAVAALTISKAATE